MDIISVLKNSKIVVQGITGNCGSMHTGLSIDYGSTNIVAGVTPGKKGQVFLGVPVFNSIKEAKQQCGCDVSIIFVPPLFAADAILECIDNNIKLIVCISEGIPIHDMVRVRSALRNSNSILIGPNSPGVILVDFVRLGIFPVGIFSSGNFAVISKSGTLTYEAVMQLTKSGIGQKICIGIGGDAAHGTDMYEAFQMVKNISDLSGILFIGEIGGSEEISLSKALQGWETEVPVFAFIAGKMAPLGQRMGHAGAIAGASNESAESKIATLRSAGAVVIESFDKIGTTIADYIRM